MRNPRPGSGRGSDAKPATLAGKMLLEFIFSCVRILFNEPGVRRRHGQKKCKELLGREAAADGEREKYNAGGAGAAATGSRELAPPSRCSETHRFLKKHSANVTI